MEVKGYAKHLPHRLKKRFEEARANASDYEFADKLALIETMILDRLPNIDDRETNQATPSRIMEQAAKVEAISQSREDPDPQLTVAVNELVRMCALRMGARTVENEVRGLIQDYKEVASTEARIQEGKTRSLSLKEVQAFFFALQSILVRHIREERTLLAIRQELAGLVNRNAVSELGEGDGHIIDGEIVGFEDQDEG